MCSSIRCGKVSTTVLSNHLSHAVTHFEPTLFLFLNHFFRVFVKTYLAGQWFDGGHREHFSHSVFRTEGGVHYLGMSRDVDIIQNVQRTEDFVPGLCKEPNCLATRLKLVLQLKGETSFVNIYLKN